MSLFKTVLFLFQNRPCEHLFATGVACGFNDTTYSVKEELEGVVICAELRSGEMLEKNVTVSLTTVEATASFNGTATVK